MDQAKMQDLECCAGQLKLEGRIWKHAPPQICLKFTLLETISGGF